MSNSLDQDQAQRFVEPDLGPNCLQRFSADDTSRQKVNNLKAYIQCHLFITHLLITQIWIEHGPGRAPKFFYHGILQKNYRKLTI